MAPNTTPVATILDRLDDPTLDLPESYWLTYGDDFLDNVIGLDVMRQNRWIFGCEPLPRGVYQGDAICVGSGPSLDQHIPFLRKIQHHTLIVAAHSAIQKLLSHDIIPHVVTPKERLPEPSKIPVPLPTSVVYAGLPLVPQAPDMCSRHYLVGDVGKISKWLGLQRYDVAVSATSGSLSAYIAAALCTGKVWLVGHDLVQGHFQGFSHADEQQEGVSACVDGVDRPSNRVYRAVVHELSGMAESLRIVQAAERGALIPGALHLPLAPVWSDKPNLQPRPTDRQSAPATRLDAIPAIWDQVISRIRAAQSSQDLSVAALYEPQDAELGQVLGQATYLSVSVLRRTLPLSEGQAFVMLRDALLHAFLSLRGWAHGY